MMGEREKYKLCYRVSQTVHKEKVVLMMDDAQVGAYATNINHIVGTMQIYRWATLFNGWLPIEARHYTIPLRTNYRIEVSTEDLYASLLECVSLPTDHEARRW